MCPPWGEFINTWHIHTREHLLSLKKEGRSDTNRNVVRASPLAQQSRIHLQCRRHGLLRLGPWVGKIPWRRAWQPNPVFFPGDFQGQRILVDCSP